VRRLLLAMILAAGFAAHGVAAKVSGVPHVGLLHRTSPAWAPASGEFREGMRSLGFVTATKEVRTESQNWPSIMRL